MSDAQPYDDWSAKAEAIARLPGVEKLDAYLHLAAASKTASTSSKTALMYTTRVEKFEDGIRARVERPPQED